MSSPCPESPVLRYLGLLLIGAGVLQLGCRREKRWLNEAPSANQLLDRRPAAKDHRAELERYSRSAWAVSEGGRLFLQMNCSGCHSHGGGGMGPPLMDGGWRYGNDLEAIEHSILQGRPHGMPAFASRLSPQQAWQLVAYVRSLGGYAPADAAPSRDDHLAVRPPPSRTEPLPFVHEKAE